MELDQRVIDELPADTDLDACEITTYGALGASGRAGRCVYSPADVDLVDDGAAVVILPGFVADDGNAEVEYPDAKTGEAAAQQYVSDGDWGEVESTCWIKVWAWRVGYALDEDGDPVTLRIDRDCHTVTLDPEEPDCTDDHAGHNWRSPHSVLGGIKENPGVWGNGGGVIIREVCAHCGVYRETDTWAQDRETGEQGLRSVQYREADEVSERWVRERVAR